MPPLARLIGEDVPVVDVRAFALNGFGGFLREGRSYVETVRARVGRVDRVLTCYETHYAAEALRHAFDVPWARIGVIEDGLASYFPHSMTRRRLQPLKSAATLARFGHGLTLTRWNLGGNPRLGLVATIAPEHVFLHPSSRARTVDISGPVRSLLLQRGAEPPPAWRSADAIVFLPPVLHYGRMSEDDVAAYVRSLLQHDLLSSARTIAVKPHPREADGAIEPALAGVDPRLVVAEGSLPVELFFHELDTPVWVGSPSTAMLNKHVLFPGRTRFLLVPLPGNRHVPTQTAVLRRILGDRVVTVP